jgi:hypothetical protein
MAIKVKSGFIYFLREQDILTGDTFDYVKIGKTDYDRPVSDRIDEHQTGNPRMILDHESFQVSSIDTVETHLHHAFAEYRILGEWFRMDESTLQEAIKEGKRLDQEVSARGEALTTAAEANELESSEPERAATGEELALLEKAIQAGEALNRLKAKQTCLEWELRASMGGATGIDGILTATKVTGQPKFDEKGLQEKSPDVYESFLVEESRLKRSFALATKTRSEANLEPELTAKQKEFKTQAALEWVACDKPLAKRSVHLADLHEQYLKAMAEISQAAINKDLLDAQIKTACGLAKGIEGVCKWSRTIETKMKFDRKSFEQKHPDLFNEHLLPAAAPGLRVSVNLMRSYPAS